VQLVFGKLCLHGSLLSQVLSHEFCNQRKALFPPGDFRTFVLYYPKIAVTPKPLFTMEWDGEVATGDPTCVV